MTERPHSDRRRALSHDRRLAFWNLIGEIFVRILFAIRFDDSAQQMIDRCVRGRCHRGDHTRFDRREVRKLLARPHSSQNDLR
ncbi:hypothetical protein QL996_04660 [Planococcus sp. APC 4015]|nr:hypothetical protein [Planococcus sp. APC 4015]